MSTFGKWSQTGVPKKGWICVGFEDLGEPSAECQMCENQQIRYVHHMEHPDYSQALDCGCVCAGKMEEDYTAAKTRETDIKNAARRKANWLKRKWKISQSEITISRQTDTTSSCFKIRQLERHNLRNQHSDQNAFP